MLAAMASGRNSIGFELDETFENTILSRIKSTVECSNSKIHDRLENHIAFVKNRLGAGKAMKHTNIHYGFPVMTMQEKELFLNKLISLKKTGACSFEADYSDDPQVEFIWNPSADASAGNQQPNKKRHSSKKSFQKPVQLSLF
jgi:hypothetical protein